MAGKIFVTGDCHAEFHKFSMQSFPEQAELNKDDYVIICGDFGGIWDIGWESKKEKYWLSWLEDKPYTTLFVDGNHENFDRLNGYPVKEWHGGKVHEIRPSILHLMRGQVYEVAGKKIFTMGGARSHDTSGGIFDTEDPDFKEKKKYAEQWMQPYRIRHLSWWEEEMPSDDEYTEASKNLERANYEVDYVITHCCSTSGQNVIRSGDRYMADFLTDFFDAVKSKSRYKGWYCGHYHMDLTIPGTGNETILYDSIIPIGDKIEKAYIPGCPKYKRGDVVRFRSRISGQEKLVGDIRIVDRYGTFGRPDEPSYDIFADYNGRRVLFKHIPETDVLGYAEQEM